MGWFNNLPTQNRQQNEAHFNSVIDSMRDSVRTLTTANQFVSTQSNRAKTLSGQAFAVQGASSQLGAKLQDAMNDLSAYQVDGKGLADDLEERIVEMLKLAIDFSLPRMQRSIPASGREIVNHLDTSAGEIRHNLNVLKNRHSGAVSSAVRLLDQADQSLNGAQSRPQASLLPRLA